MVRIQHSFFLIYRLDTSAGFAVLSSEVANLAFIGMVGVMVLSGAPFGDQQTSCSIDSIQRLFSVNALLDV